MHSLEMWGFKKHAASVINDCLYVLLSDKQDKTVGCNSVRIINVNFIRFGLEKRERAVQHSL